MVNEMNESADEPKKMTRQELKVIEAKRKLLSAAEELFSQKEIDKVGLREICTKAGVTTGTFYYHFRNKADILDKIYRNKDDNFGEIISGLMETPPYCDRIVDFFADTLAVLEEKDGIDFTMHRLFQLKKHSSESDQLYIMLKKLIGLAVENGELQSHFSVEEMNDYLFMVFRGVTYEWCIAGEPFDLPNAVRKAEICALKAFK